MFCAATLKERLNMQYRATIEMTGKLDQALNIIRAVRNALPPGSEEHCQLLAAIPHLCDVRRGLENLPRTTP